MLGVAECEIEAGCAVTLALQSIGETPVTDKGKKSFIIFFMGCLG